MLKSTLYSRGRGDGSCNERIDNARGRRSREECAKISTPALVEPECASLSIRPEQRHVVSNFVSIGILSELELNLRFVGDWFSVLHPILILILSTHFSLVLLLQFFSFLLTTTLIHLLSPWVNQICATPSIKPWRKST